MSSFAGSPAHDISQMKVLPGGANGAKSMVDPKPQPETDPMVKILTDAGYDKEVAENYIAMLDDRFSSKRPEVIRDVAAWLTKLSAAAYEELRQMAPDTRKVYWYQYVTSVKYRNSAPKVTYRQLVVWAQSPASF